MRVKETRNKKLPSVQTTTRRLDPVSLFVVPVCCGVCRRNHIVPKKEVFAVTHQI